MTACSVPGCDRAHEAHGLCGTHYARLRRTGSVHLVTREPGVCAIKDCSTPARQRGLCHRHYERLRRTGTTDSPRRTLRERLEAKVERVDDCWLWTATTTPNGYGQIGSPDHRNRMLYAHRVSYELLVGPIPDGLELDHLCHTNDPTCPGGRSCLHRRCVNPAHLEPVTQAENQRRARQRRTA